MKDPLRLAFMAFVALLFAAVVAFGDDGYEKRDGYWWKDGVAFDKWTYYTPIRSYGYQQQQYRTETTYEVAYPQPKKNSRRPDYAKFRAELGAIMKAEAEAEIRERELSFEHSAALELLEASGIPKRLKARIMPTYPLTSGFIPNAFGTQYGNHGIQGQTVWTYGNHFQANLYGNDLDVNLAFQGASNMIQNAGQIFGQGVTDLNGIVAARVAASAAAQERFAELAIRDSGWKAYLQSLKPQDKATFTQKEFTWKSAEKAGPPIPQKTGTDEVMATILTPACASCHTGPKAQGKFEIASYPTMSVAEKAATVWKRILTDDETLRMPRSKPDFGPGPRLSAEAVKRILTN